jgi:hypothetical protein
MKGLFTVAVLIVTCSLAFSQKSYELSHQVLVPAAGIITAGGISYQQTVGETAVEATAPAIYVLTQGFQQPRFIPQVALPPREGNGVDFFPNPVTETVDHILNIRMYGVLGRHYDIMITNFLGSVLYRTSLELSPDHDYVHQVNIHNYSNGIYIVRVLSTDGVIDRSFKLEKL